MRSRFGNGSAVLFAGVLFACLLSTAAACEQPPAPPPPAPGILFIAVDDLNDWIGPLGGHPDAHTPNFDRLAARSITFTRAYTVSPECNPSRSAVMTGLLPTTTGVYRNNQPLRSAVPEVVTLAQRLRQEGFATAESGKVLHEPDPLSWIDRQPPERDPEPPGRPVNGLETDRFFDWGPLDQPASALSDYQVTQWAAQWLARRGDEPFFLAVGLGKPHLPWFVPREYFEALPNAGVRLPEVLEDDLDDVPQGRAMNIADPEGDHQQVLENGLWPQAVASYLASVHFADAMVGRLLDALEASPAADRTIVILWSDHGFHLGEKEHWRKSTLWEEGTRVPLFISAPGITTPGSVCSRPASLLDLYPTVLDLVGLPLQPVLAQAPGEASAQETTGLLPEGKSLVPWLKDPQREGAGPVLSMLRRDFSVRSERWRYTDYVDAGEELYDHAKDPHEWTNLLHDQSGATDPVLQKTREELSRFIPQDFAPDGPTARRPPEDGPLPPEAPEAQAPEPKAPEPKAPEPPSELEGQPKAQPEATNPKR